MAILGGGRTAISGAHAPAVRRRAAQATIAQTGSTRLTDNAGLKRRAAASTAAIQPDLGSGLEQPDPASARRTPRARPAVRSPACFGETRFPLASSRRLPLPASPARP